jgi:tetratricopeptide (TPR) repeat protein
MAPEQARGETESVDRRADVFALGSILCEILTGWPAFHGNSAIEILHTAERADTAAAMNRLASCDADEVLLSLARDCLAAASQDRPADAGVVASRLTDYLVGVQERLRSAELARAAESARAEEAEAKAHAERRARSLTRAMAATVLLMSGLAAAGWRWIELDRLSRAREATAKVSSAIQEATRLRGQAQGAAVGDLAPWTAALSAAEKARDLLAAGVEPRVRQQVENLVATVLAERVRAETDAAAAQRDRQLLDHLVDIRSAEIDDLSGIGSDTAYTTAFRDAGIDLDSIKPEQAVEYIKSRPPTTAAAMAMALDDWAAVRRDLRLNAPGAKRVEVVARLADPDPWRNKLREALELVDKPARRAALTKLADSARDQTLPAVSFDLLGRTLGDLGSNKEAETILRRACRFYPDDLWLNYDLAVVLGALTRREESIRYFTAARIIRPESAHELAHALEDKGETEDAFSVFRDLARIRPRNGRHLSCLGRALKQRGAREEARVALTAAETLLREAVAERPDNYVALLNLGNVLKNQGRLDESLQMYRKALQINPEYVAALENVGITLFLQRKYDEAMTYYRNAITLKPDTVAAYQGLSSALEAKGQVDDAIEVCREGLHFRPDNAQLHNQLGFVLEKKGRFQESLIEKQEALRLTPDNPDLIHGLGTVLSKLGRFEDAAEAFRNSLAQNPGNSYPLNALAWLLVTAPDHRKRNPEEALKLARKGVEEGPDIATNYNTLGLAEYRNGLYEQAIATLNKSIEMNKGTDPSDFFFLAMALTQRGDRTEADRLFERGVAVASKSPPAEWEWTMLWGEAAEFLGKPGPVPILFEVKAEPDRAMDRLRRMASSGFLRLEVLRTSPDLAPLRGRPDFQLLVMDLAMPADPFAPNL